MPAPDRPAALAQLPLSHLIGMTAGGWLCLLRENRFRVDPRYLPRALVITAASVMNSLCRPLEIRRMAALSPLQPQRLDPLFILGHWRSGTTLLHNFLAAASRLAAPDLCQVLFPHSFLTAGPLLRRLLHRSLSSNRLIDNMAIDPDLPQEDEFALCVLTGLSPYAAYAFPRNWDTYERYLTFDSVSEADIRRWQEVFRNYVTKLARVHGKQLVLKSPPHTARLRLILEIFPDARFGHCQTKNLAISQSPGGCRKSQVLCAVDRQPGITNST